MREGLDLCPTSAEHYERTCEQLRSEFGAWAAEAGLDVDPDAGEDLCHYKWGYLNRDLGWWTTIDLDAIFLQILPAKMIVEGEHGLDRVLSDAKTFLRFLAEAGYLDSESDDLTKLIARLDRIRPRFQARMADSRRYSWGKKMWLAMAAEGITPDQREAVQACIARFNARPKSEREALLGTPPGSRSSR
ncbi:MAG: hypothetical protein ACYDHP_11710 [Ferrimicrobium sp.]